MSEAPAGAGLAWREGEEAKGGLECGERGECGEYAACRRGDEGHRAMHALRLPPAMSTQDSQEVEAEATQAWSWVQTYRGSHQAAPG